jgi:prolyl-tRNA editing enzyme YbaK/EbsC (Cys-tRNA(Pro) deacylase)/mannose-6-phosphate isomerase-like protein (cupin superfamily)
MSEETTYERLLALLDRQGAKYRLIDHAPEGRTEIVSRLRGNGLRQAAKCIVVMVKVGKKTTRYVLAVVPGDRRVDLEAIKRLLGGTYVSFASAEIAERLAGSVSGTILPFAFDAALELLVDPELLEQQELFFNAARLDRSIVLDTAQYVALARPRIAPIALADGAQPVSSPEGGVVQPDDRRPIAAAPRFGPLERIDLREMVEANHERCYNETLCQVNDSVVRLGVVSGDYHWHRHEKEDEFFYVVDGRLIIELADRSFELGPGQGLTVPRGAIHRTVAPERAVMLMIERVGVVPTGDG